MSRRDWGLGRSNGAASSFGRSPFRPTATSQQVFDLGNRIQSLDTGTANFGTSSAGFSRSVSTPSTRLHETTPSGSTAGGGTSLLGLLNTQAKFNAQRQQGSLHSSTNKATFAPTSSYVPRSAPRGASAAIGNSESLSANLAGDDLGLKTVALPTLDAISRVRECADSLFSAVDERYAGAEVRRLRLALSVLDQNAYTLREGLHQAHLRVHVGDDALRSENEHLVTENRKLQQKIDEMVNKHAEQGRRLEEAETAAQSKIDTNIERQRKQWDAERASLVESYEQAVRDETRKRREAEARALELEEKTDAAEAKYQDSRQAVEILKGEIMALQSNGEVTIAELHSKLEIAHQKLRLRSKGLIEQDRLRSGFDNGLFEHLEGLTEKYTRAQHEIDQVRTV